VSQLLIDQPARQVDSLRLVGYVGTLFTQYTRPIKADSHYTINQSINQSFICQNKNKDTTSRTQRLRQHW